MKHQLVDELKQIFANNANRYEAHVKCKPVLEKMASSKEFLFEVIKFNLSNTVFLQRKRSYSTLSMSICESNEFSFVVNIFPPLPDRATDISFQSIHHHGSLILCTVAAFGPGYESILFKKGYNIDKTTGETKMEIEKKYQNETGKVEFVDTYQPHIVFYPKNFSATFALWCDAKKTTKDVAKKIGILKKIKKPITWMLQKLGLSGLMGINNIEYFDFYVEGNKIIALKERLAYTEEGSNENFLQNIFCFIQKVGFKDKQFLESLLQLKSTSNIAKKFLSQLLYEETVSDQFFEGHLNIPKVNLKRPDILAIYN